MTTEKRNNLFMEHLQIVTDTVRENRTFIRGLSADEADIEQDLSLRLLSAIDEYETHAESPFTTYLTDVLHNELRRLKEHYQPYGLTQLPENKHLEFLHLDGRKKNAVKTAI